MNIVGAAANTIGTSSDSMLEVSDIFSHLDTLEDDVLAGGDNIGDDDEQYVESSEPVKKVVKKSTTSVDEDDDFEDITVNNADDLGDETADEEDKKAADDVDETADEELIELSERLDIPVEMLSKNVEVVIDGETSEVHLREALNGYIRMETMHRRMNKLNEDRTIITQEAAELYKDRNTYINLVKSMQEHLDQLVPKEPDWDKLSAEDYKSQRKLWDDYSRNRSAMEESKLRAETEQHDLSKHQVARYIANENAKIKNLVPSWNKNPDAMTKDFKSMAKTARSAGFNDRDVKGITDHRLVAILLKASRYDKMMATRSKLQVSTKPAKSGVGSVRTAPKASSDAQRQLARSGSIEDAANAFKQFL